MKLQKRKLKKGLKYNSGKYGKSVKREMVSRNGCTDLNLATHLNPSAMGADAYWLELHRVVPLLFSSNQMLLFMILPELQAKPPILLSIVILRCTIWSILYSNTPSKISYVTLTMDHSFISQFYNFGNNLAWLPWLNQCQRIYLY